MTNTVIATKIENTGVNTENTLPTKKIRVLICWPLISGYIAACWQQLALRSEIDLFVIAFAPIQNDLVDFSTKIMEKIPHFLLSPDKREDIDFVRQLVEKAKPEVMIIGGWSHKVYRQFFFSRDLKNIPIIMTMDNPFRGDFRQLIGRFVLSPLLNRISFLFVPGEKSWRLARFWGVPENKIRRGSLSIDQTSLKDIYRSRIAYQSGWPKTFLYVGRYHSRKGIETLLEAYYRYRVEHSDPWPLRCAGMGPLAGRLETIEGVENLGFVQPYDLPMIWQQAGAFVLASHYEPWGLVVIEAAAAGLPIVCTEACGASVEVVRPLYNGFITPTNDPVALSEGLAWVHNNYERLPEIGVRSCGFAAAYSAELWAERVMEMVLKIW